MIKEIIAILPFLSVLSLLLAVNGVLIIMRTFNHPKEANDLAKRLAPLVQLLKLGGRDSSDNHRRNA